MRTAACTSQAAFEASPAAATEDPYDRWQVPAGAASDMDRSVAQSEQVMYSGARGPWRYVAPENAKMK
eukprot:2398131-Lingulodinium_polyedra.AAC.1